MSKAIKRNTEALQTFCNNRRSRIPQATRTKIRNIINLYSERKIAQFTTADNLIRKLTTPKTDKENAKAENEYNKMVTPPPTIHPSLLVNCSSTILCLRMLSPKSINHRYLRGFLLFTYTDLCLLCSFLVYVNHPKPKPESGSASALKHLSPSQPFSKTKETAVVFAQLVLFSVIRNPVSSRTMAGTQRALTICQYHKIESECFGEESGLPPANSKYIRWHVEVCRASYAL